MLRSTYYFIAKLSPVGARVLHILSVLGLVFCLFLPETGSAGDKLYVTRGRRGTITFTSRKPPEGTAYSIFNPALARFSHTFSITAPWFHKPVSTPFDEMISSTSEFHGLDRALVKAVVHIESFFNPKAKSPKGAMGLMQLMPGTADRFGVFRPFLAEENVKGGVSYLSFLKERYKGDVRLTLAAYNAGEGNVDKFKGIPPFRETQVYVGRVMKMWKLYQDNYYGAKKG